MSPTRLYARCASSPMTMISYSLLLASSFINFSLQTNHQLNFPALPFTRSRGLVPAGEKIQELDSHKTNPNHPQSNDNDLLSRSSMTLILTSFHTIWSTFNGTSFDLLNWNLRLPITRHLVSFQSLMVRGIRASEFVSLSLQHAASVRRCSSNGACTHRFKHKHRKIAENSLYSQTTKV